MLDEEFIQAQKHENKRLTRIAEEIALKYTEWQIQIINIMWNRPHYQQLKKEIIAVYKESPLLKEIFCINKVEK